MQYFTRTTLNVAQRAHDTTANEGGSENGVGRWET